MFSRIFSRFHHVSRVFITFSSCFLSQLAGGPDDVYRYNPWRAPGFAPVSDACGLAGGRHAADPGGGDAVFTTLPAIGPNGPISLGDQGSDVLKKDKASAIWQAGSTVAVAWGIRESPSAKTALRTCFLYCFALF